MALVMSIQKNTDLTYRPRTRTAREKRPSKLWEEAVESFLSILQHFVDQPGVLWLVTERQLLGSNSFCLC